MFKKKIKRLLLSIIERIESFFNYLEKLKKIKIKKNITIIDKKNFIIVGIILTFIIVYFLIPVFNNKNIMLAIGLLTTNQAVGGWFEAPQVRAGPRRGEAQRAE